MNNSHPARKLRRPLGAALGFLPALMAFAYAPSSSAGATFKIDDTKWLSIGAGLRTSFDAQEDGTAHGTDWSNNFNLDNMRLYVNAQVYKYIKLEFNTEVKAGTSSSGDSIRVLDAIGKFEFDPAFNIWGGRMLVPAERRELNGPFYSAIYDIYSSGTPFESSDFNTQFESNGTSAGAAGRDQGATIWGSVYEGRAQYAVGVFQGLVNGANQNDDLLYAQRLSYNFLDVEKNPGYYTSGTYYGKGGDILTLAVSNQYQYHGAGTVNDPGSFRGTAVDLLYEQNMPNNAGVLTFNGEYKNYGITGFNMASRKLVTNGITNGFAMFEGQSFDTSVMYLVPGKVGIGQFQPYLRYVEVMPIDSSDRNTFEGGLNYIIDGHNAKIMLMYNYGDLATKGLNYTDTASGPHVSSVRLGLQLQI